jgi:hypothetical protein
VTAAAGIRCVRECSTARRYMTLYKDYSAAHPGFDAGEPLDLPF